MDTLLTSDMHPTVNIDDDSEQGQAIAELAWEVAEGDLTCADYLSQVEALGVPLEAAFDRLVDDLAFGSEPTLSELVAALVTHTGSINGAKEILARTTYGVDLDVSAHVASHSAADRVLHLLNGGAAVEQVVLALAAPSLLPVVRERLIANCARRFRPERALALAATPVDDAIAALPTLPAP
jgi:hypothetical protein